MKRERSEVGISFGLAAVLTALFLVCGNGFAGGTCITGNCNAPAQNYDIRYADDPLYCNQSTTGGIQEAVNSCGTGTGSGSEGCVVVLPRGEVLVRETIVVGPGKYGITLRGHGNGVETSTGVHIAGTTLLWAPDTGCGAVPAGPVLEVHSTAFSRFEDFAIDGNLTATTGILYTASAAGGPSQQNTFENILIENIANGAGHGIALDISPITTDLQVSESTLRHVFTRNVDIGIRTQGLQTTGIWIEDSNITCRYRCLELIEGDAYVHHSFISGQGPTADADIWIGKGMNNVQMVGTVHESCSRAVIYTEDNHDPENIENDRHHTTTMIGGRVQHFHPDPLNQSKICDGTQGNSLCGSGPCNLIDHNQPGAFNLYSNEFKAWDIGQNPALRPKIEFSKGDLNTSQLRVSSIGNLYTSDVQWVNVDPNTVFIASTDDLPGEFESMTWQTRNIFAAGPGQPQQHPLVLQNLGSDVVAWITQQGNLHFRKTTASVDFEGATNGHTIKIKPSSTIAATTTVTLPNRTGTAVVSGDQLTTDVLATFSDTNATVATINDNAVEPSDVNDGSDTPATGECLKKASGDQFEWSACGGTSNTFATHNATLGTDPVADSSADTLNYADGRSVSVTGDAATDTLTVDADAELFTDVKSITIKSPATADDDVHQLRFPFGVTLSEVACSTKSGSVAISFEERTSPNTAVTPLMSTLTCNTTGVQTSTFTDAAIAAGNHLNLNVTLASGTGVRIHVKYTVND